MLLGISGILPEYYLKWCLGRYPPIWHLFDGVDCVPVTRTGLATYLDSHLNETIQLYYMSETK